MGESKDKYPNNLEEQRLLILTSLPSYGNMMGVTAVTEIFTGEESMQICRWKSCLKNVLGLSKEAHGWDDLVTAVLQLYTWILWHICNGFPWSFGKIHRPLREWSYHGTRGMVLLSISFSQVRREKKEWADSCQKGRSFSQGVTRSLLESLVFSLLLSNLKHRVKQKLYTFCWWSKITQDNQN